MIFVFAALGEFVVVKVLDVQYQYQINRVPKVLPMVWKQFTHIHLLRVLLILFNSGNLCVRVCVALKIWYCFILCVNGETLLANQCNGKRPMSNGCHVGRWKCSIAESYTDDRNNTRPGRHCFKTLIQIYHSIRRLKLLLLLQLQLAACRNNGNLRACCC